MKAITTVHVYICKQFISIHTTKARLAGVSPAYRAKGIDPVCVSIELFSTFNLLNSVW